MRKLTKEQIEEIRKIKLTGVSDKDLAIQFKVAKPTIIYWTNEKYYNSSKAGSIKRFKELTQEKKKEMYNSKKEYMKNYMKNRYHSDPVFRQKHIDLVKSKKVGHIV